LAQRFPRGELVVLDSASHYLPIERPDAVLTAIRDVLGLKSTTQDTLN
jgi:pimeloyl-ACP methyl ester carboxylesterase